MTKHANLAVDGDRLWQSLMDMAEIGPGVAGGNNRQTLTDADAEGRRLLQKWSESAGMLMGVDKMGSMFMTRAGTDPKALPVRQQQFRITDQRARQSPRCCSPPESSTGHAVSRPLRPTSSSATRRPHSAASGKARLAVCTAGGTSPPLIRCVGNGKCSRGGI